MDSQDMWRYHYIYICIYIYIYACVCAYLLRLLEGNYPQNKGNLQNYTFSESPQPLRYTTSVDHSTSNEETHAFPPSIMTGTLSNDAWCQRVSLGGLEDLNLWKKIWPNLLINATNHPQKQNVSKRQGMFRKWTDSVWELLTTTFNLFWGDISSQNLPLQTNTVADVRDGAWEWFIRK